MSQLVPDDILRVGRASSTANILGVTLRNGVSFLKPAWCLPDWICNNLCRLSVQHYEADVVMVSDAEYTFLKNMTVTGRFRWEPSVYQSVLREGATRYADPGKFATEGFNNQALVDIIKHSLYLVWPLCSGATPIMVHVSPEVFGFLSSNYLGFQEPMTSHIMEVTSN